MINASLTLDALSALVEAAETPVILLEGRRSIPADEYDHARVAAEFLAKRFPGARFRSGNAKGSDEAFSQGVAAFDATRLQLVAPYATHRLKARFNGASYAYPAALSDQQRKAMVQQTVLASPKISSMMAQLGKQGSVAAKADYLLRDTMKVAGFSDEFPKVTAALFYVDIDAPMDGGTGHTIRVCQQEGVPFAFQNAWKEWGGK